MKKTIILLLLWFASSPLLANPHFLGNILTVGYIKGNIINYTIKKGELDTDNDGNPFVDGEMTFNNNGLTYRIETDSRGRVTKEEQYMLPSSYNEMNSLIESYKREGRVTKDETSESFSVRNVALYLRYSENVVISSDITGRWTQNDLGRKWDFSVSVTYILTSRY